MTGKIERMAYCSRSQVAMNSLVLIADILAVSQRNNRRDEISGALMYSEGVFFQVIEGAAVDLDRLLRRLDSDPRHAEIRIIARAPVTGRLFGDWSMMAPRITPARELQMKTAIQTCESTPISAIETLRRMSEEDLALAADQ
jgi:hypothetical protein